MLDTLWSITLGSWLTAAVIVLIRILFGKLISDRTKYLLWLLLAVRLCMPGLPESAGSIENMDPWQDFSQSVETQIEDALDSVSNSASKGQETTVAGTGDNKTASPLFLWALGMVSCFGIYGILSVTTKLRLRRAIPVEDPETLHALVRVRGRLGVSGMSGCVMGRKP